VIPQCGPALTLATTRSPYLAGFVVPAVVAAAAWRVFDRAAVAQAYAEPTEPVPYTWTNG